MQDNRYKRNSLITRSISTILMFMYIYEFDFVYFGLPTIVTSRRIAVVCFGLFALIKYSIQNNRIVIILPYGQTWKYLYKVLYFQLFLLTYVFAIYLVIGKGTGEQVSDSIIRLILFGIIPVFFLYYYFDDVDMFFKSILYATLLQAVIIIICLSNVNIQTTLDTIFASESDYIITHRKYYAGGIACITAPGSLKFSIGLIASVFFFLKSNKNVYIAIYIFLAIIAVLIARTGAFVAGVGLLIMTFVSFKSKNTINAVKYLLVAVSLIVVVVAVIDSSGMWGDIGQFLTRYSKLSNGLYEGFFQAYFFQAGNHIPELSIKTIFGTGITSGTSGNGVYVYADGGFLRLYVAFGLPLCIVFYCHLMYIFIQIIKQVKDSSFYYTLIFFLATIIIAEIKEFTLYKQYYICIFFSAFFLYSKQIFEDHDIVHKNTKL